MTKRTILLAGLVWGMGIGCAGQLAPQVAQAMAQPQLGTGHAYIQWMGETVDPSSGNVSLRICLPLPKGRGVSLPFCVAYDSTAVYSWLGGEAGFRTSGNVEQLMTGGWSYTAPQVTANADSGDDNNGDECDWTSDAVFSDPKGAKIPLSVAQTWSQNNACEDLHVATQLSGEYAGYSTDDGAMTVTDAHGTTYVADNGPATQVMDANGNYVNISWTGTHENNLTYSDTAGRTLLETSGFGSGTSTITPSGLGNFSATWSSPSVGGWETGLTLDAGISPPSGCSASANFSVGGTQPMLSELELPNGQSFSFTYDPTYGLLTKVVYPSGGYVRYVWGMRTASSLLSLSESAGLCYYYYGTPVITDRYVSYDGSTETLHQQFSYGEVYPAGTGTTTETDTNPQTGQVYQTVAYSYALGAGPSMPNDPDHYSGTPLLEQAIVYKNNSGTTMRTVGKTWNGGNPTELTSETTTLDNGEEAETAWSWDSYYYRKTEEKDYDYGSGGVGALLRQTQTTYAVFAGYEIVDRPASVEVEDGSGCLHALTNYGYDQYASLEDVPTAINHDDTGHGSTFLNRGNLTTQSAWLSASSPDESCISPTSPGGTYLATTYTYDDTGQPLTSEDPKGNTTQYGWADSFASGGPGSGVTDAYLTKITYPQTCDPDCVNHIESATWNYATGEMAAHTDQNSQATSYSYSDALNRITTVTDPPAEGGETTYTYTDTPGAVKTETKRLMSAGVWTDGYDLYDGMGREVVASAANGEATPWDRTDTCYDGEGRISFKSYPYQGSSGTTGANCATGVGDSFTYDGLGREVLETHSDGTTIITSYAGRATETEDEGNNSGGTSRVTKVAQEDGLGRLASVCEATSVTDAAGNAPTACGQDINLEGFLTAYTYNTAGKLTWANPASPAQRSFQYDSLGRLLAANNPETGTTSYSYDGDGNVLTRVRPAPNQTDAAVTVTASYTHDALNRMLTTSYSDGVTPGVSAQYDQASTWGETLGYPVGRMTEEGRAWTGGGTAAVYSYDPMGREAGLYEQTPGVYGGSAFALGYGYDKIGDVLQSSYARASQSVTLTNTYNVAGRATGVASGTAGTLIAGMHYNAQGEEWAASGASATLGNGLAETRGYTARGWENAAAVGTVYSLSGVTYAPDGDLLNVDDSANGTFGYTFNALNQLTQASCTAVCTDEYANYTFDRYGNRWTEGQNISGPQQSLSFTANNQISGYSYDAAGNLLNDGAHSYSYDAENRLIAVDGGTTASYEYDAEGRRVHESVGGVVKEYVYGESGQELTVVDGSQNLVAGETYVGGRYLGTETASGFVYAHADELGTVRARTNASGSLVETDTNWPYGEFLNQVGSISNLHYTGKYRDGESGLDDFGARYYSPALGRFMTPDWSEDPEPVPYADLSNPQSLNLYSYVLNNPVTSTDADGHLCCFNWLHSAYEWTVGGGSYPMPLGLTPQFVAGAETVAKGVGLMVGGTVVAAASITGGIAGTAVTGGASDYLAAIGGASGAGMVVGGTAEVMAGLTGNNDPAIGQAVSAVEAVANPIGAVVTAAAVATGSSADTAFTVGGVADTFTDSVSVIEDISTMSNLSALQRAGTAINALGVATTIVTSWQAPTMTTPGGGN